MQGQHQFPSAKDRAHRGDSVDQTHIQNHIPNNIQSNSRRKCDNKASSKGVQRNDNCNNGPRHARVLECGDTGETGAKPGDDLSWGEGAEDRNGQLLNYYSITTVVD